MNNIIAETGHGASISARQESIWGNYGCLSDCDWCNCSDEGWLFDLTAAVLEENYDLFEGVANISDQHPSQLACRLHYAHICKQSFLLESKMNWLPLNQANNFIPKTKATFLKMRSVAVHLFVANPCSDFDTWSYNQYIQSNQRTVLHQLFRVISQLRCEEKLFSFIWPDSKSEGVFVPRGQPGRTKTAQPWLQWLWIKEQC